MVRPGFVTVALFTVLTRPSMIGTFNLQEEAKALATKKCAEIHLDSLDLCGLMCSFLLQAAVVS